MATRPSRYRSSTSASNPPATSKATEILHGLLERVGTVTQARTSAGYPDIQTVTTVARHIHQHIAATAPPCDAQEDFRRLQGFQQLLNVLRAFSGFYNPQKRTETEKGAFFELLHVVLAAYSAAFREHYGNRQYFRLRVEGGGWEALEQTIASMGLGGSDSDHWSKCQLFGKLLSFSLDDQRLDELFQEVARTSPKFLLKESADGSDDEEYEKVESPNKEHPQPIDMEGIESRIRHIIGSTTLLQNPQIMRTVVGFWESIPRNGGPHTDPTSLLVLATLSSVITASFFNLAALHGTGVLSRFLRFYFAPEPLLSNSEKKRVLPLCQSLMYLGANTLSDAQFLLSSDDETAADFCLEMAERYGGPSFVQFDLSLHGHSSIELPNLGRPFPPLSSPGYTFTCWFRIDRFDPASHTTIFGVFDSTQTCFLLAYLEKDTHNFILQTSVTSSRPSVRFKSVKFKENQWYHLALVHRRPKTMTASKASLYVNGEFVEQIRTSYPNSPPIVSHGSTESFASFTSSTNKTNPVQAFIGTPKDLSQQHGSGLIWSRWSMSAAYLFEDVLSDDYLAVHYRLGPRYQGNFQDCLGGFQTYEASAALGLRNEDLHPGKDEGSDILKAIRDKASNILPESKVMMSIMSNSMFRRDGHFIDSLLFRSLSRLSAGNMRSLTTKNGTSIAINGAIPCINDALLRAHGVSVLSGDPVLSTPYYFDDDFWRLGGFTPVALKIVERSRTPEDLVRAVELMLLCVSKSWRNSEAMERDSGYAVLGAMLRTKLGYGSPASEALCSRFQLSTNERDGLSFQLLSLVLAFVGFKHKDPLDSFIVNPLAYRILLIDIDTWRKSSSRTQELYYKQFSTFAVNSKYHNFNTRRLLRMRTYPDGFLQPQSSA
jgi:beige protein homolog 1